MCHKLQKVIADPPLFCAIGAHLCMICFKTQPQHDVKETLVHFQYMIILTTGSSKLQLTPAL